MASPRMVAGACIGILSIVLLTLTVMSIVGGGGSSGNLMMADSSQMTSMPAAYMGGGSADMMMRSKGMAMHAAPVMSDGDMGAESMGSGDGGAEPVVVHSADLSLGVLDVHSAARAATELVKAAGGFVVRSSSYGGTGSQQISMTVRVPAAQFDSALASLSQLAKYVYNQHIEGQDVTEQVVDLQAQIRTLEAVNARMLELLQKASTVSEAVAVQRELTPVADQLERYKSRLQFLQQSAKLSRISIHFMQYETNVPTQEPSGFNPLRSFVRAFRALLSAVAVLLEALIYAVVFSTPVAALLLLAYWAYRRRATVAL